MRLQKKPINPEKPINNSKSKLGKRANHEKQTFGSWLTAAPVCFQAPRTAPATSMAVSFGVWCGENSFCSGDLCGGGEGSTGFLSSFSAWSPFGEAESPRGRSLLAGVKH